MGNPAQKMKRTLRMPHVLRVYASRRLYSPLCTTSLQLTTQRARAQHHVCSEHGADVFEHLAHYDKVVLYRLLIT